MANVITAQLSMKSHSDEWDDGTEAYVIMTKCPMQCGTETNITTAKIHLLPK